MENLLDRFIAEIAPASRYRLRTETIGSDNHSSRYFDDETVAPVANWFLTTFPPFMTNLIR
jgi:hypothetical protein